MAPCSLPRAPPTRLISSATSRISAPVFFTSSPGRLPPAQPTPHLPPATTARASWPPPASSTCSVSSKHTKLRGGGNPDEPSAGSRQKLTLHEAQPLPSHASL